MDLVLATYNIHRCIGRDGRQDLGRITRILNRVNPDFAALQEVESHSETRHDMLGRLAAGTGLFPIAGPTMLSGSGTYGNGLLARHPPLNVVRHDISYEKREPRGAIEAIFQRGDNRLRIITTHLGLKPIERRRQAGKILDIAGNEADDPHLITVLMGDINEWFLWGRPLRWLHGFFGNSPGPRTFPSGSPLLALDRIWCHPRNRLVKVFPHKTLLSRMASDHLPLIGIVRL